jgi:DNA end-binding protein Ku
MSNRLRQQVVDDVTREPVESEDEGKGFEYAKNSYIPIEDKELEAIKIESSHTIEIDSFVPREQIDDRFFESPYYIVPDDRSGWKRSQSSAKPCAIRGWRHSPAWSWRSASTWSCFSPGVKGSWRTTLRYPYEIRDSKDYFDEIPDVKIASAEARGTHCRGQAGRLRSCAVRRSL